MAEADIAHLLQETLREFGSRQVQIYAALIDRAITLVAEAPDRPSSKDRSDLAAGVRAFPVSVASGRRRGASHVLYFTVAERADHGREVVILRVLHDRMEPRPKLIPASASDEPEADAADPLPA